MGEAARKLLLPSSDASARWDLLRALPISAEPPNEEEAEAFADAEAFIASGQHGAPSAEVATLLEEIRRDQGA